MPVDSIISILLGSIVGFSLAFAQFLFSSFLSSKAVSTSLLRTEMVMLFGFLFKLMVLGVIFFGLSKIPALHFVAMLVSFLVGVTGLLVWRTISTLRMGVKARRDSGENLA